VIFYLPVGENAKIGMVVGAAPFLSRLMINCTNMNMKMIYKRHLEGSFVACNWKPEEVMCGRMNSFQTSVLKT
jgi:hypothetical protein